MKLAATLETVPVLRTGPGRPKQRPEELIAAKAYGSKHFRGWLRRRGIKPTIPSYEWRLRKRPKRGRPVKAGPGYAQRWKAARTFAWQLPEVADASRALPSHLPGILLDSFRARLLRCLG